MLGLIAKSVFKQIIWLQMAVYLSHHCVCLH